MIRTTPVSRSDTMVCRILGVLLCLVWAVTLIPEDTVNPDSEGYWLMMSVGIRF
jgi:hypothetical protein